MFANPVWDMQNLLVCCVSISLSRKPHTAARRSRHKRAYFSAARSQGTPSFFMGLLSYARKPHFGSVETVHGQMGGSTRLGKRLRRTLDSSPAVAAQNRNRLRAKSRSMLIPVSNTLQQFARRRKHFSHNWQYFSRQNSQFAAQAVVSLPGNRTPLLRR